MWALTAIFHFVIFVTINVLFMKLVFGENVSTALHFLFVEAWVMPFLIFALMGMAAHADHTDKIQAQEMAEAVTKCKAVGGNVVNRDSTTGEIQCSLALTTRVVLKMGE